MTFSIETVTIMFTFTKESGGLFFMSETMDALIPEENKMGTMPVNKLLLTMSLPMVISMLIQALYNVVDSIFVAQIGETALTAVSLAFPIQNLIIAIAVGTGVGVNALLSRSLGRRTRKRLIWPRSMEYSFSFSAIWYPPC